MFAFGLFLSFIRSFVIRSFVSFVRSGSAATTPQLLQTQISPDLFPFPLNSSPLPSSTYSDDVVELLLLRLTEWLRPLWWCRLLRWRPPPSWAGSPWTTPLRASMPPLTEKLRHTMKARMAAFSCASPSDSYARSVWYSRPLTRTRHVNPAACRYVSYRGSRHPRRRHRPEEMLDGWVNE